MVEAEHGPPGGSGRHALSAVRIVDAQPFHRDAVLAFLGELSPHTAYSRFVTLAAPADVVDVQLMLAADASHRAVLAVRGEEVLGHAHGVTLPDHDAVELGVVVADAWQGIGIGYRLVRALLATGPAAVADELEFFVLVRNTRARRMIERSWPGAVAHWDGQFIHYRVRTGAASDARPRRLSRPAYREGPSPCPR